MEAILKYALVLLPLLLVLWLAFGELRKKLRTEVYGAMKITGALSFAEAIDVLERGGSTYPRAFEAAQLLGELPPSDYSERAVRALAGCLDSPEPKLRLLAAMSLGRIGDASAIPALRVAANSVPRADERAHHQAASFDKQFLEARARREGYSIDNISVSAPEEVHADVRQAASWAIQEISKRHGV